MTTIIDSRGLVLSLRDYNRRRPVGASERNTYGFLEKTEKELEKELPVNLFSLRSFDLKGI